MTTPNPYTSTSQRLGFWTKLGYGSGNFGLLCVMNAATTYLLFFYTEKLALAPLLAAVALAVPRFWDAVSDPLMGVISDRTVFPQGRRRPYILLGAPFLALAFSLLWCPWSGWSASTVFAYFLVANLFFTTMITIVGVPYTSLGGELSTDYHERTTVFAYSQGLGMLGGLIGFSLPAIAMVMPFSTDLQDFAGAAFLIAIPTWMFLWLTFASTRETVTGAALPRLPLKQVLATAWNNRAFRVLAVVMIVVNSGMMLGQQYLPFLMEHWVKKPELLSPAFAVYTLAAYLGFPLWKRISESRDKKHVLAAGFTAAGIIYALSFFMLQPSGLLPLFGWAFLIGLCAAAGLLFPFSMIADIADEDELATGVRAEGIYYGAYSFIGKLSLALGSLGAGVGLRLAGYEAGTPPSDTTLLVLRLVFVGPLVTFLVAALAIYRWYPLTRERAHQVRSLLTQVDR